MTTREINMNLKRTAQAALYSEYGFQPALDRITLLEGSDDRTYIRFKVGSHEYSFDSYKWPDGSVWVDCMGVGPSAVAAPMVARTSVSLRSVSSSRFTSWSKATA